MTHFISSVLLAHNLARLETPASNHLLFGPMETTLVQCLKFHNVLSFILDRAKANKTTRQSGRNVIEKKVPVTSPTGQFKLTVRPESKLLVVTCTDMF